MQREAAAQNAVFLHAQGARRRPFVALKLATSLDAPHRRPGGALALDQRTRGARLGAVAARRIRRPGRWQHIRRALDDPSLTVRGTVVPRRTPRRVVFGRSSQLSAEGALARTARETPTTVFVAPGTGAAQRALASRRCGRARDQVAGRRRLRRCATRRSRACWWRAGGNSPARCSAEDLVDRLYWVQSPLWLGEGVPAVTGLPGTSLELAPRWRVVERRALGEDTLLVVDRR